MKNISRRGFLGAGAAVAAVAAFGVAGCSSDKKEDTKTTSDSKSPDYAACNTKELIVGFDAEYPPYGYLADKGEEGYKAEDGNTYAGFDLDMANGVCGIQGWKLTVKPINWDSKDALLGNGDINCIWNGFTMEGREGKYTFSEPYMLNSQVVVVKSDSDINKFEDLAGKKVLTQADSAASDLLGEEGDQAELGKSFEGGAVQTIADYNNAFMQLESGQVAAVACDLSVAMHHMNNNAEAFKQLETTLQDEHYVVGFPLGDEETANMVNEALHTLDEKGEIEKLAMKHTNDIDYENLWCLGK